VSEKSSYGKIQQIIENPFLIVVLPFGLHGALCFEEAVAKCTFRVVSACVEVGDALIPFGFGDDVALDGLLFDAFDHCDDGFTDESIDPLGQAVIDVDDAGGNVYVCKTRFDEEGVEAAAYERIASQTSL